jgi:hypothetical protein
MAEKVPIFIFLLTVIANIYIFIFFIQKHTSNLLYRIVWFLPSLLLLIGLYIVYFSDYEIIRKDFFTIFFLSLTLPTICFAMISSFDLFFKRYFNWKFHPFTLMALIISFSSFLIILFEGITEKNKPESNKTFFYSLNEPMKSEK